MNFFQKFSIKDKITALQIFTTLGSLVTKQERPVKGPVKPQTFPSSASTQKENVPEEYFK